MCTQLFRPIIEMLTIGHWFLFRAKFRSTFPTSSFMRLETSPRYKWGEGNIDIITFLFISIQQECSIDILIRDIMFNGLFCSRKEPTRHMPQQARTMHRGLKYTSTQNVVWVQWPRMESDADSLENRKGYLIVTVAKTFAKEIMWTSFYPLSTLKEVGENEA